MWSMTFFIFIAPLTIDSTHGTFEAFCFNGTNSCGDFNISCHDERIYTTAAYYSRANCSERYWCVGSVGSYETVNQSLSDMFNDNCNNRADCYLTFLQNMSAGRYLMEYSCGHETDVPDSNAATIAIVLSLLATVLIGSAAIIYIWIRRRSLKSSCGGRYDNPVYRRDDPSSDDRISNTDTRDLDKHYDHVHASGTGNVTEDLPMDEYDTVMHKVIDESEVNGQKNVVDTNKTTEGDVHGEETNDGMDPDKEYQTVDDVRTEYINDETDIDNGYQTVLDVHKEETSGDTDPEIGNQAVNGVHREDTYDDLNPFKGNLAVDDVHRVDTFDNTYLDKGIQVVDDVHREEIKGVMNHDKGNQAEDDVTHDQSDPGDIHLAVYNVHGEETNDNIDLDNGYQTVDNGHREETKDDMDLGNENKAVYIAHREEIHHDTDHDNGNQAVENVLRENIKDDLCLDNGYQTVDDVYREKTNDKTDRDNGNQEVYIAHREEINDDMDLDNGYQTVDDVNREETNDDTEPDNEYQAIDDVQREDTNNDMDPDNCNPYEEYDFEHTTGMTGFVALASTEASKDSMGKPSVVIAANDTLSKEKDSGEKELIAAEEEELYAKIVEL